MNHDDLIERLRNLSITSLQDMVDAADAIAALVAERDAAVAALAAHAQLAEPVRDALAKLVQMFESGDGTIVAKTAGHLAFAEASAVLTAAQEKP